MNNTPSEKTYEHVKTVAEALKEKKGEDVRVLDIHDISSVADYFIIAAGNNERQIQTLSDNVEEKLKKEGIEPAGIEGYPQASWILLDYTDFVVHIFSKEDRLFYELERIWKDGKEINIESLSNDRTDLTAGPNK